MALRPSEKPDLSFEIAFCESILRHDDSNSDVLGLLAGLYTRAGRVDDGLAIDLKLVSLDPSNPTSHYNLACSYALKGRRAEAVETLREAIQLGYDDFDWMLKDADLKGLHAFPPFQDLLREFQVDRKPGQS